MRRFRYIAPLLLTLWLVGCGGDTASDLTIVGIEVSQGVQTTTNSIALVAERSTVVRVMLETGSSNAIADVSGLLAVSVDGVMLTPVGGIAAVNEPITVPATPDRDNENDSLYFELAAPTGITASSNVDFSVVVAGNAQFVEGEVLDLTFVETTTPTIHFILIDYLPSGLGLPDPTLIDPGVGDTFVKGILPVDDSDASLYQLAPFPGLVFDADSDNDGLLNCLTDLDGDGIRESDCDDPNDLLSALASLRSLFVALGVGVGSDDFIYGWLAGNPTSGLNGLAETPGFSAFGNTQASRHQRTFAHELIHNFGLSHNSRTLDQTGWDRGASLVGNPTTNNTTGRVKGTSLFDIMVSGQLTNGAWVDTTTYTFLLGSPLLALAGLEGSQLEPSKGVLVVQGRFNQSGEILEKLEPAFRFPWLLEPRLQRSGDPYVVEVIDEQHTVYRHTFDARVADDSENEQEQYGFFEVRVPVPPNRRVVSLRIRDAENPETVYFSTTASEPPTITLTSPQPGASLGESTEVSWKIADPDTEPVAMQLQIAYSFDKGESWVPLAVDIEGSETSVVVNTRDIPKSEGQGVIRVFVSDGLNTHFDEVEGLSTPRAIY